MADRAGVLLNVEDDNARSDFHSPAVVRRGDLTVAISTGGKHPGLAAAIRRQIDACFDPEWGARLDRAAALRSRWRAAGLDTATIARRTMSWLDREAGLSKPLILHEASNLEPAYSRDRRCGHIPRVERFFTGG
jgi:precorrin-2 dehydrogenase/sirohydrochlorin ferrochelatase